MQRVRTVSAVIFWRIYSKILVTSCTLNVLWHVVNGMLLIWQLWHGTYGMLLVYVYHRWARHLEQILQEIEPKSILTYWACGP